jgi:small subunit ribosomal protein S1
MFTKVKENNQKNGTGPQADEKVQNGAFAQMLEDYLPEPLKQGQFVTGEVLKIDKNSILANVEDKRTAVVPREDIERVEEDYLSRLKVGDEVVFYVLRTPEGDEDLLVSLNKGLQQQDWLNAKANLDNEDILELEVIGHNKGGLLVAFGQLQGFVPASHVPQLQRVHDQRALTAQKAQFVGEALNLKVIEVDREQRRLVLSAKKAQKEVRQQRLLELKERENETISGTITNLVHFGAFVDLDGIEGLIHISEIAWEKVDKPADFLSIGDEIELMIQSVDVERERIGLSRKALLPSPWENFAEAHAAGDLLEGVVTNVTGFGAFLIVAEGIEGLVHVSEIRGTQDFNPQDILAPGDTILVRILKIEPERQRLALSQQRVTQKEEMDWIWQKQQALEEIENALKVEYEDEEE